MNTHTFETVWRLFFLTLAAVGGIALAKHCAKRSTQWVYSNGTFLAGTLTIGAFELGLPFNMSLVPTGAIGLTFALGILPLATKLEAKRLASGGTQIDTV